MADNVGGSEDRDSSLFGDEPRFQRGHDPFASAAEDPTPGGGQLDDAQVRRLIRRIDQLWDRLDESDRRAADVDERTGAMQARLEDIARALGLLGRRLQEQTAEAAEVTGQQREEEDRLAALERRVGRLPSADELAAAVAARGDEFLGGVEDRLQALEDRDERILALVDGVSAALDAEGAALRMAQERTTAIVLGIRDELTDLPESSMGAAVWEEVMARVERAMSAQASRVETVLAGLREAVTESRRAFENHWSAAGDLLAEELARTRDLTADRLAMAQEVADAAASSSVSQAKSTEAAMLDVADELRQGLSGVAGPLAEVERSTDELTSSTRQMAGSLDRVDGRVDAMDRRLDSLEQRMEAFDTVVRERVGGAVEDGLSRLGEELAAHRGELERSLADQVDRSLADARDELESAAAEAEAAGERFEAFEAVLAAVLSEHNQALADQRQQLVYDLVASLADGLTKRDRRRLAAKIEVPPPPATTDMSRRIREVFDLAADRMLVRLPDTHDGSESQDEDDDSEPADKPVSGTARAPKRVLHKPGAAHVSPDPGTSGSDDMSVKRVLDGVQGLRRGPRNELARRYASLAALRSAPDRELLEIRGIGQAMLERIREAIADG